MLPAHHPHPPLDLFAAVPGRIEELDVGGADVLRALPRQSGDLFGGEIRERRREVAAQNGPAGRGHREIEPREAGAEPGGGLRRQAAQNRADRREEAVLRQEPDSRPPAPALERGRRSGG